MKLLTLNTHSLRETDYDEKANAFADFLLREKPDIIALQEVNQTCSAPTAKDRCGMAVLQDDIPLKADNHALGIARKMMDSGVDLSWTWVPVKRGYGRYDEGLALISLKGELSKIDVFTISKDGDYENWRTRRVLGMRIGDSPEWFYSLHMGWWQDAQEPFASQWERLNEHLSSLKTESRIWLMGDFNAPAEVRGQSYDMIAKSGWKDIWLLAGQGEGGATACGNIDGWKTQMQKETPLRIDHIWCNEDIPVKWAKVVFDGKNEPVISDHFGLFAEIG